MTVEDRRIFWRRHGARGRCRKRLLPFLDDPDAAPRFVLAVDLGLVDSSRSELSRRDEGFARGPDQLALPACWIGASALAADLWLSQVLGSPKSCGWLRSADFGDVGSLVGITLCALSCPMVALSDRLHSFKSAALHQPLSLEVSTSVVSDCLFGAAGACPSP